MLPPVIALLAATVVACAPIARVAKDGPEDLVIVRAGTMPIIITAPHGGTTPIPGVAERDRTGRKGPDYVFGVDTRTDQLALRIADDIKALTGKEPYVVVARFERKFIDANREPGVAFDDPKARQYYERYHGAIRRFVDEVRSRHGAGVLLDVHAQVKMRDSLLRGTKNGASVAKLTARAGYDAITGPRGLFGQLEANGFKVFPPNSLPTTARHEDAGFNGGHTVVIYGSGRRDGIDAVQLEFGATYIVPEQVGDTAARTARAIVAFYETYLKQGQTGKNPL